MLGKVLPQISVPKLSKLSWNCEQKKVSERCCNIVAKWSQSCHKVVPRLLPSCPKWCLSFVPMWYPCDFQILSTRFPSVAKSCPCSSQWCQVVDICGQEMCWVSACNLAAVAKIPSYNVVIEDWCDIKKWGAGWCISAVVGRDSGYIKYWRAVTILPTSLGEIEAQRCRRFQKPRRMSENVWKCHGNRSKDMNDKDNYKYMEKDKDNSCCMTATRCL